MERLKMVGKAIALFLYRYKFTILALAFFYITCRALYSNHNNQYILLALSFLFLLNGLSKSHRIIKWGCTVLFSFLIAIDTYFAYVLGESLSFGVLDAIINTNPVEVKGALIPILKFGLPIFLGLILLFSLVERELKAAAMGKKLSFMIFGAYWVIFLPIYSFTQGQNKGHEKEFKESPFYMISSRVGGEIPLIYRNITMLLAYNEQMQDIKKYMTTERAMPKDVSFDENRIQPTKIYFVIGESAVHQHMSLYGYNVKTTPFLDSLLVENDALEYYDAISCAPFTTMTLTRILSFGNILNDRPIYEQKNILELAKDGGYETVWISNQGMLGTADSYIGAFVSVSDSYYYMQKYPPLDMNMIPILDEKIKENEKQFLV